jgi:type II secretory pathway predicted ATPase ExeA
MHAELGLMEFAARRLHAEPRPEAVSHADLYSGLQATVGILAALDQRIAVRYTMPGMTGQETTSYITHHLTLAGRSDPLFSDDATALIHATSRGLPRAVNNLAIQALVAAYASRKAIVDETSARAAATEVTAD